MFEEILRSRIFRRRSARRGALAASCRVFAEPLEGRRLLNATLAMLATFGQGPDYSFGNVVSDQAGNLYGARPAGGADSMGFIFEVPAGSRQIITLVSFDGADGAFADGLTIDANGNLFGTTSGGGVLTNGGQGDGTLFEVPAGSRALHTLAVFDGGNGSDPTGGIAEDAAGNLYGTASEGGSRDGVVVFEWEAKEASLVPLVSTSNSVASIVPEGLAVDSAGNLYGVTEGGSVPTVFEIVAGTRELTTLAQFPELTGTVSDLALDASGNLYGIGDDQIFELPKATHQLAVIGEDAGIFPEQIGLVVDAKGNLFGVADGGWTVFQIAAGSHAETTVATFNGTDGSWPITRLVADAAGNLYGETLNVSPDDDSSPPPDPAIDGGSIFEISHSGFAVGPSAPVIFSQPSGQTGVTNGAASFTVVVGSSPAPAVQWQESTDGGKKFANITDNASATTQTLTLTGLTPSQNGMKYRAVFTNALGTVCSNAVKLSIVPLAVVSPAHSSYSSASVGGTQVMLSALGDASNGETHLSYRWSAVRVPSGAGVPSYSENNSNAARHTVATFNKAGRHVFRCDISDGEGHTVGTDIQVEVQQQATSLRLAPHDGTVAAGKDITFHGAVCDQFGHIMPEQSSLIQYSLVSGPGTIGPNSGVFSSTLPGAALIEASDGNLSGTAGLGVIVA